MNDDATTPEDKGAGFSRRSVVRAGATAVWTVPVIAVVTAAPAFAMSGKLSFTTATASRSNILNPVQVTSTVKNSDTSPTNSFKIQLTITPDNPGSYDFSQSTTTVPAGFTASTVTPTGPQNHSGLITYTATSQLAAGASIAFNPAITLPAINGLTSRSGSVTLQAIPGGAGIGATAGPLAYT